MKPELNPGRIGRVAMLAALFALAALRVWSATAARRVLVRLQHPYRCH
jgi:hypothetical protein